LGEAEAAELKEFRMEEDSDEESEVL